MIDSFLNGPVLGVHHSFCIGCWFFYDRAEWRFGKKSYKYLRKFISW